MISLITYQDVKRLTEERQRRSLAIYESRRKNPNDSYNRRSESEADVIELVFGTACEPDSIGA